MSDLLRLVMEGAKGAAVFAETGTCGTPAHREWLDEWGDRFGPHVDRLQEEARAFAREAFRELNLLGPPARADVARLLASIPRVFIIHPERLDSGGYQRQGETVLLILPAEGDQFARLVELLGAALSVWDRPSREDLAAPGQFALELHRLCEFLDVATGRAFAETWWAGPQPEPFDPAQPFGAVPEFTPEQEAEYQSGLRDREDED